MKVTRAVVPSLFTVLNMFCGFMSIINSSNGSFHAAAWFIVLAAGFDALDGVMARLTKSTSDFGVEIDSLSDVVSFGAAPSFLVYTLSLYQLEGAGIFLSSLLMIFGGLRLARFNVNLVGHNKEFFVGLPIPVSAITVVLFVLSYYSPSSGLNEEAAAWLPWMTVILALLMVSKIKYETLPRLSKRAVHENPVRFLLASTAVLMIAVTHGDAAFPLAVLFIIQGIVRSMVHGMKQAFGVGPKNGGDDSSSTGRVDV